MSQDLEKKIENFIADGSFYKIYSRNSSVYTVEVFGHAAKRYLKELYGVDWSEIAVNKNEFCGAYGLGSEQDQVFKIVTKRIKDSNSIKDFYEDLALPDYETYISLTNRLREKYSSNLDRDFAELKGDFDDFHKAFYKLIAQCYIIFMADQPVTKALEAALQSNFPDDSAEQTVNKKQLISVPLRKSAVVKERINFLKLKLVEDDKNFLNQLEQHAEEYNWFPIYNASDEVYSLDHYKEALSKLSVEAARDELDRTLQDQEKHEQEYKKFLETITEQNLLKVIALVNEFSYYREYRNDIRRKGLRNAQGLFDAIAKQLGITRKEVCYMNTAEIRSCLFEGKLVLPQERLQNRMQGFVELFDRQSDIVDDAEKVDRYQKLISQKVSAGNTLEGTVGSKGQAIGTVLVIDNIQKLNDMAEGHVLVTSMTGPDYVPAMRKAAAVVTDEGGITCHAAIIARELGIPCVIGTKVATEVLKDGMEVEVDADRGIVKII